MEGTEGLGARVRERFPEVEERSTTGMETIVVGRERITGVLAFLRDEVGFDLLSDLCGVDWLPREPRFEVNYHLTRTSDLLRLRVKVLLGEDDTTMPTATDVYPTANWHEREVYDFFGIDFSGHPGLERIFMPDEWIGHPLRKDYAIGGVPVEFKLEPAYVGERVVSEEARPAAGGVPGRLARDRGRPSRWTWTGPPATGVRIPRRSPPEDRPTTEPPPTPGEPYTEGGEES